MPALHVIIDRFTVLVRASPYQKMNTVTAFIASLFAVSLLSGCSRERYGETHSIPQFHHYKLDRRAISKEDGQRFIDILKKGKVTRDQEYEISDFTITGYPNEMDSDPQVYSVYLKSGLVYEGYWLDARTFVLMDKDTEFIKLTRSDVEWLAALSKSH